MTGIQSPSESHRSGSAPQLVKIVFILELDVPQLYTKVLHSHYGFMNGLSRIIIPGWFYPYTVHSWYIEAYVIFCNSQFLLYGLDHELTTLAILVYSSVSKLNFFMTGLFGSLLSSSVLICSWFLLKTRDCLRCFKTSKWNWLHTGYSQLDLQTSSPLYLAYKRQAVQWHLLDLWGECLSVIVGWYKKESN